MFASVLAILTAAAGPNPVARGVVTDLRDRPLPNVLVQVRTWHDEKLGEARTDQKGGFQIPLSHSGDDLTLVVEYAGFRRWALAGAKPKEGLYVIKLGRLIDATYLKELVAQPDAAGFRALARDLLTPSTGTVGEGMPLGQLVPFLEALGPRLRDVVPQFILTKIAVELPQEQESALRLLGYLSDSKDDRVVDAWAAKRSGVQRPTRPCRGPSVAAATSAWIALHFELEGIAPDKRPFSSRTEHLAPQGRNAVVEHFVRYAHWGYSQELVLVRAGDTWEVRRVIEGVIDHFRE